MPQRILIVDDEVSILELLVEALNGVGYEVDSAETAERALELVKENLYDAAIVDFALPDMNGVMLHHEIRKMDSELAGNTLFVSGLAQEENDLSYFKSVGSGFLPKPFEMSEVLRELKKLIEETES